MRVVLGTFALGLTACASVSYSANGTVPARAARGAELIVVHMMSDPPPRDFVVAGELHASSSASAKSLELLRQEAAKNGLDGVADVVCAPSGSRDDGSCEGKGFVYR